MSDDGEWFAPKQYGLGAGAPIAWQGWAVVSVYAAALAAAAVLLVKHHHGLLIAILVISTVAFTVVTAQHTKGGWQWRWGARDDK